MWNLFFQPGTHWLRGRDSSVGKVPDSWSKGCDMNWNPGTSGRRIFFSWVNFLFGLLFCVRSTPMLPQRHVKDPSFLDFAVCVQTMQTSKKKLRKWSTSFFKDDAPKTRSKKLSTKSDPSSDKKHCSPTTKRPPKRDRSWVSFTTTPRLSASAKSSCRTGVSCRHALRWPRSLANHHWSHTNETLISKTC